MEEGFNFVATTYRNRAGELIGELNRLLVNYRPIHYVEGLPLNSVVYGKLYGDPVSASKELYEITNRDPWSVRRVLKFYPIQINCRAEAGEIQQALASITNGKALNDVSVEVEIRLSNLKWEDLVKLIRPYVEGKLFKKASRVLVIQVLMNTCGISLIFSNEIFRALEAKLAGSYFP